MKLKDLFSPVFFIVLGLAFLAVSVWVWLGKGENAKAIKTKYKLGGMILSLSFFTTSCVPPIVTCYEPAMPPNSVYSQQLYNDTLVPGDTVFLQISDPTYKNYSYTFSDSIRSKNLQQGLLTFSQDSIRYIIPINKSVKYTGKVFVDIYGEPTDVITKKDLIFTGVFQLNEIEN